MTDLDKHNSPSLAQHETPANLIRKTLTLPPKSLDPSARKHGAKREPLRKHAKTEKRSFVQNEKHRKNKKKRERKPQDPQLSSSYARGSASASVFDPNISPKCTSLHPDNKIIPHLGPSVPQLQLAASSESATKAEERRRKQWLRRRKKRSTVPSDICGFREFRWSCGHRVRGPCSECKLSEQFGVFRKCPAHQWQHSSYLVRMYNLFASQPCHDFCPNLLSLFDDSEDDYDSFGLDEDWISTFGMYRDLRARGPRR